jgi:hypothetical protein
MTWKRTSVIGNLALALAISAPSGAQANLVLNGDFEETTNGPGQFNGYTTATHWTTPGYNYGFIFAPGTADGPGSPLYPGVNLELWGPKNLSNNGLTDTSPALGNFASTDGAFASRTIQQTIYGLTKNDHYAVGFWWAGAQQYSFTGETTEQWQVSFGAQTQSTPVVTNLSHGFTGWMYQEFNFTADSTSVVLSFLGLGTPTGLPPFVLLDGVSVTPTPEPSTLLCAGISLIWLGALRLRRYAKSVAV